MRMRAAAESGGADLPCSQRSTVRTGTRIICANTALETSSRFRISRMASGVELGEWPGFDAHGAECDLAGVVLANLAETVENLGCDVAFSHC